MPAPVSLTLIVKNEANNLRACLAPLTGLVTEVIVVDTGSTDGTRELAEELGARIVDFAWCDDFAAARNEGLRHVRCPWVFWMDADDRVDVDHVPRLESLFAELKDQNVAYLMKVISPRDPVRGSFTVTDHVRVFRNDPRIRWENRIHEQIRSAVERSGGELRWSDVVITHLGYQDPRAMPTKAERNLRLLLLQDAESPGQPFVLFNIGRSHKVLGRMAEALAFWHRALALAPPQAFYLRRLYTLLVSGHDGLNQTGQALALCVEGRRRFPDDLELLFHEGTLRIEIGDFAQAEGCLRNVLAREMPWEVTQEEPLLRSKCWHNLAALCLRQGRLPEAERHLHQALAERPDYLIAWQGLAQLWIGQGRWEEAEHAIRQMEGDPQLARVAAVARERLKKSRPR